MSAATPLVQPAGLCGCAVAGSRPQAGRGSSAAACSLCVAGSPPAVRAPRRHRRQTSRAAEVRLLSDGGMLSPSLAVDHARPA